jgi:hypothetical protein
MRFILLRLHGHERTLARLDAVRGTAGEVLRETRCALEANAAMEASDHIVRHCYWRKSWRNACPLEVGSIGTDTAVGRPRDIDCPQRMISRMRTSSSLRSDAMT